MTHAQQQATAKKFADFGKDKRYEKDCSQPFWLFLICDVLVWSDQNNLLSLTARRA